MKHRSVWVVVVASMMLLSTSQADLAYAGLKSMTSNAIAQGISSGSWAAVAGADQNVTSADRAGSGYPMVLSSTGSTSVCTVIHLAIYKTRTSSAFIGTLKKEVNVDSVDPKITVGMPVSGPGVVAGNTVEAIDPILKLITLTIGGNTTNNNQDLLIGNPSGFDSTTSSFSATTTPFPVNPEGPTWNNSSTGTADVVRIQDINKFNNLKVGMLVQELVNGEIGSRIANSGTNKIKEKIMDGTQRIVLTNGGNSTLKYGELLFNNFCPGSGSSSSSGFFTLKNTGDFAINSMSITQTGTAVSAGNTLTWSTCSGTWTESTGACSTTPVTVLTTTSSSGAQQLILALSPGQSVRIKAHQTPASGSTTLNISVSVATSDLAPATASNA